MFVLRMFAGIPAVVRTNISPSGNILQKSITLSQAGDQHATILLTSNHFLSYSTLCLQFLLPLVSK